MKNVNLLVFFLAILLFFSCKNDDENFENGITPTTVNPEIFLQNFGSTINRNFLGTVIDTNNNPIENVQITIGSSVVFTDANGVFSIENAAISERFGFVKAEKEGYIHGSRAVIPTEGTNKVTIMLLDETVTGTTQSGSQATISLPNGASVSLNGAYANEDGSPYNGSVNVILHHLDPTDENMPEQMPGMLLAANAQNEVRLLKTLGMIAVELRGTNGEDLNLAENSSAEIRIPVAPELLSEAPSTIPLWYFDEENGYWIEEGEAELIGNEYIGTVTHFTFWNCDVPFETTFLCVTVLDTNNQPVTNAVVKLITSNLNYAQSTTNGDGENCGLVPTNETLTLQVFNPCDTTSILYITTFDPLSAPTDITITIDIATISSENIVGNFVNCDGNIVTDGYVTLTYEGNTFIEPITNGTIDFNLLRCSSQNTFTLEGIDAVTLQSTGILNYSFTSPITSVGAIAACNSVTEFISYQVDNQPTIFYDENFTTGGNPNIPNSYGIRHQLNSGGTSEYIEIGLLGVTPGSYAIADGQAALQFFPDANGDQFNSNTAQNITIVYNLSSFGAIGEYIDINFSGTYTDTTGNHSITGIIHVLRDL